MIAVSACLIGKCCKYSGGHNRNEGVLKYLEGKKYMSFCPEELGGLPIPRNPAEIDDSGRVADKSGRDITEEFLAGARASLELCERHGVTTAILKERSPSCGVRQIYDGTFSGTVKEGQGICATMLEKAGISLYTEEDFI